MGKKFIISIDLGTTGNRVFCFDEKGFPLSSSYAEFTQHFPKAGWVEHDPLEIWDSVVRLFKEAFNKGNLDPKDALCIGIANQRETALIWNRETGKPVHNAIVWQCRRTTDICNKLKADGHESLIRKKTGLFIDAYFSGTKVKWLLDNIPGARNLAKSDKLLFGTMDSWILWKLTCGRSHKTDHTNASRTMMYNIKQMRWDKDLLELLDVPENIMPEVCESASVFGETCSVPGLPDGIVIGGIAGDQQAAMIGQNCVFEGSSKNTYGTGCFVLQNTGKNLVQSKHGLLTTIASDNHGKPVYALEGSIFIAGAVIQWLRDYMKFFKDSAESDRMVEDIQGKDDDIVLIPAFAGLGAPWWDMDARGAIFGITRDTTTEQIVRAALKSIAFQSMDVINAIQQDSGKVINELRVDGGLTANKYLMQFQADLLDRPVLLPDIIESTSLGAAYLAGITAKLYNTIEEVAKFKNIKNKYVPNMSQDNREKELAKWHKAVQCLISK